MNFQKTHIKSSKFTLQNVINTMVWFGSCDAFTPRPSWVLTAALFREWSENGFEVLVLHLISVQFDFHYMQNSIIV